MRSLRLRFYSFRLITCAVAFGFALTAARATAQELGKLPYVPTPQIVVDEMLKLAGVTANDFVIDLGSGDGRTVITAGKRGVPAMGIEFNPDLVGHAQRQAEAESVGGKVSFMQGDIFATDFSKATVVTLFLLPELNERLRPTLLNMKPGTRVVSNTFEMGDWEPDDRTEVSQGCTTYCRALLWIVPAKVEGTWRLPGGDIKLTQTYQKLAGTLTLDGRSIPISDGRMKGDAITLTAGGKSFTGKVNGDSIALSDATGGAAMTATRAP